MKFSKWIGKEINYLVFLHRKYLINKSDKKIKRLDYKLNAEKKYNRMLAEDTLKLIEEFKVEVKL